MIEIQVDNRSGAVLDERELEALCRRILAAEGIEAGDLGVALVELAEMRALKQEHLGIDEPTDVLSFPIDGKDELETGPPRQLGDVILCPDVVGEEWRWPLVHGLLHLLGHEHGTAMETRERAYLS